MLDDGVAIAEEDDVKVGVRDGVAIDEDLGDRVGEVGDNLRDGGDLLGGRRDQSGSLVRCTRQLTRREVPMTIIRSTSSRSSSRRWSNSSESISLRAPK